MQPGARHSSEHEAACMEIINQAQEAGVECTAKSLYRHDMVST